MKSIIVTLEEIEADRHLIMFKTYEDYLDSLVTCQDLKNLRSTYRARIISELGYRSTGDTLSRNEFYTRLKIVTEVLFPTYKPYVLASEGLPPTDPVQQELALRERGNRLGILSTIVYVTIESKAGFEVSGYIDYAERLATTDWIPFFQGKKKLLPRQTDLAYYHWRAGKSHCNHTANYKVIIDPVKGLLFQNKKDRKVIRVDPDNASGTGTCSNRVRIYSDKYEHVVIFDHVVRQRI